MFLAESTVTFLPYMKYLKPAPPKIRTYRLLPIDVKRRAYMCSELHSRIHDEDNFSCIYITCIIYIKDIERLKFFSGCHADNFSMKERSQSKKVN